MNVYTINILVDPLKNEHDQIVKNGRILNRYPIILLSEKILSGEDIITTELASTLYENYIKSLDEKEIQRTHFFIKSIIGSKVKKNTIDLTSTLSKILEENKA